MKFGYEGADNSELIENYEKNANKIIIKFLDGSIYELPLSEENESLILDSMIAQAQVRNDKMQGYNNNLNIKKVLLNALIVIFFSYNCYIEESKWLAILYAFTVAIASIDVVKEGKKFIITRDKIEELDKYDLYLSFMDEISQNYNNPQLLDGINNGQTEININTLDNFSLKEVKQVLDNINCNGENVSGTIDSTNDDIGEIKKLSKRIDMEVH